MSDLLGNVVVPTLSPSLTHFPSGLTVPFHLDFGFTLILDPPIKVHTFGAANQKREQRFILGPGSREFQISVELTEDELASLLTFWEEQFGSATPFPFDCPLEDGTTEVVNYCVFQSEPLVWDHQTGNMARVQIKLREINLDSNPVYPIASTFTRFPDSGLLTALTAQAQTLIPLVRIRPRLKSYPDIFVSDRRCVVGDQQYLPRLLRWEGIGQVAVGLPNISPESDDVTFVFGNADRAMRLLADDVQLDLARIEFSLYHVATGILLNLWAGEIIAGGWESNQGPEFTIRCSDPISSPFLVAPPRVLDRMCWKMYNDHANCPFQEESTGLDTAHFPSADSASCDHGYETDNGCLAHGMKHRYGGVVARPQSVRVKDNTTGLWGLGRSTFTSVSLITDSAYGLPLPIIATDIDIPVACLLIAGRDEGDFYEAMGVVCQGPVQFSGNQNGIGQSVDGIYNHGYPGQLGLRTIFGNDPAGPTDYMSLDQKGDQRTNNPDAPDWRLVYDGSSTFLDNFAAGVAACIVRIPNAKGLQLTSLTQHQMQAWIKLGQQGWIWSAPGSVTFGTLTNPVWLAANIYLLCLGLFFNSTLDEREAVLDIDSLVAAAAICDLPVPRIVELDEGLETQFKAIGILKDQRALRDWLNDILANCLGFYYFSFGRLSIGIRENASAAVAYTDGNMLWRSVAVSALGPQFTKLICNFADREYNWANNSAIFQDDDYASELGGGVRPNHRIANFNLAFTADISQASRIVETRGREEVGGITADERRAGRRVTWKTTVLGLDTYPGQVASITDVEIPGGFSHYRIERWKLLPDYSIELTGRYVTASMYDLVAGPKPADVRPGAVPPELFPEPNGPEWHPAEVTPLASSPIYDPTDLTFSLAEIFAPLQDGGFEARVFIVGHEPINSFASSVSPPQILQMGTSASGGALEGNKNYFVTVWLRFSDGTVSPPSNVISLAVPAGSSSNTLNLSNLRWPAIPPSLTLTGYSLGAAPDDARQMCWQFDVDTTSLPSTISLPGPLLISSYNVPNIAPKKIRGKVKLIKHSGTNGVVITAVDTGSISCHDLATLADDWTGRNLSVILDVSEGVSPLWDFKCTAYDSSTGTFSLTPDPKEVGVDVGDVIVIRLSADISSSLTVGDSKFVNGQYPSGMVPDDEIGKLIYLKKAKIGRWQIRRVVSNTSTTYTIDRAWDTGFEPAPGDFWFSADPEWRYQTDSSPFTNPFADAEIAFAVPVPNFTLQPVLVGGFVEDFDGKETPEELCHLQEIWITGAPGTAGAIGFNNGPEWAPFQDQFAVTDALFPNEYIFHVQEDAVSVTSGRANASLTVYGRHAVNTPIANAPAPTVTSALVQSGGAIDGGGAGDKIIVQVCAMNDADNNAISPASDPLTVEIPAGAGNEIVLQGITWPAGVDGLNKYVIFASRKSRPDLVCAQKIGDLTGNGTDGYTPTEVTLDTGFSGGDLDRSTWAVPNIKSRKIRVIGYPLLHGGVLGATIDEIPDSTHFKSHATIDTDGLDDWSGRVLCVFGAAGIGFDIPYTFRSITAFDAATGQYTVSDTSGLEPGMVFMVCTKGVDNSGDPHTVTDTGMSNASNYDINTHTPTPHSGLATDQDKGAILRVIAGTSRGMQAEILSNTGTSYHLATPIPIDSTSVWVVYKPTALIQADSNDDDSRNYQDPIAAFIDESNINARAVLLIGFQLDNTGTEAGPDDAPVRMAFLWGQAGIFTETGHIVINLPDDSATQGPTGDGTNATSVYGNIHETGVPFIASFSCVGAPTTADTILDVLYSRDGGATWDSIFPTGGTAYMPTFPMGSTVARINHRKFKNVTLQKDTDIVRVDVKQSGGATGINLTVKYGTPGVAS